MFKYSNQTLRKFICNNCGKYLSVVPIKVKKNGLPICGRCQTDECAQVSVPLTSLIEFMDFPCINDRYGCTEKVFSDYALEHEKICKYSQNEMKDISTFSLDGIDGITCDNCKKLLNVFPIYQTSSNKLNCGRCQPLHIQEAEDLPSRQVFLEDSFSHLHSPCCYSNQGCKKLLLWGHVESHEIICKYRNFPCPSLPYGKCDWSGPAADFTNHFRKLHPQMIMGSAATELDLKSDNEMAKLFSQSNETFLLLAKVSIADGLVWLCVRYLGDSRLAENFQFRVSFKDENNFEELATRKKDVATNVVLNLVKDNSISFKVDLILSALNEPKRVLCFADIYTKSEKIINCKFEVCNQVGLETQMEKHQKECSMGGVLCKWPNCKKRLSPEKIEDHEKTCNLKRVLCDWSGCTEFFLPVYIPNHHSICSHRDNRTKQCHALESQLGYCSFNATVVDLLQHLREKHINALLIGEKCKRTVVRKVSIYHSNDWDYFYIKNNCGLFFCGMEFGNSVQFFFQYLGKNGKAQHFHATLEFTKGVNKYSQTIHKCFNMDESTSKQTINVDQQRFVENNQLTFTISILRK